MTLNCCKVKVFGISPYFAILGGNNGYTNEDSPIVSATKCAFQQGQIMLILPGVPPLGGVKQGIGVKNKSIISKTVGDTAKVTVND